MFCVTLVLVLLSEFTDKSFVLISCSHGKMAGIDVSENVADSTEPRRSLRCTYSEHMSEVVFTRVHWAKHGASSNLRIWAANSLFLPSTSTNLHCAASHLTVLPFTVNILSVYSFNL